MYFGLNVPNQYFQAVMKASNDPHYLMCDTCINCGLTYAIRSWYATLVLYVQLNMDGTQS